MSPAPSDTVIQVTTWNSPYLGNFMASQLALAPVLARELGLRTHLVLGTGAATEPWIADLDAAGVAWSVLPEGRAGRAHLERIVEREHGVLLHSHFTSADLVAAGAARGTGIPCVWHMHTGFLGYPPAQRLKDLYKIRLVRPRSVRRVIAVGPWLAELAVRRGVPERDVVLLPNGLVVERFIPLPDRAEARSRLGLDPDAFVALLLGWWPLVKGTDVMLEALTEVARRGRRPITGLVVGEQEMEALIGERFPDGDPPWLVRSRFVSDAAWLYAAADVFVSASRHEGMSYSLGEAMASELPVVLSRIVGTAQYEAAPGASTFPTEDAAGLAGALEALAERPAEERLALGRANRAWVAERLGIGPWCRAMAGVYAELLDGSASS